jgi:hypothetical protein
MIRATATPKSVLVPRHTSLWRMYSSKIW